MWSNQFDLLNTIELMMIIVQLRIFIGGNSLHTSKSFGYETWVLSIDLVKAFDTVNRNLLLQTLKKIWTPGKSNQHHQQIMQGH